MIKKFNEMNSLTKSEKIIKILSDTIFDDQSYNNYSKNNNISIYEKIIKEKGLSKFNRRLNDSLNTNQIIDLIDIIVGLSPPQTNELKALINKI